MATPTKKSLSKKLKLAATKENVAKLLAAVGAVGVGAALFAKRDKLKQVVDRVVAKAKKVSMKKTSDKKAS